MYRILVADDDINSRKLLWKFFREQGFGECDIAVNGLEVIDAVMMAMEEEAYYDLICLDIMMPKLDGIKALKMIRDMELQKGMKAAKVIMTTAISESEIVSESLDKKGADAYAIKPLDGDKLLEVLEKFDIELIKE